VFEKRSYSYSRRTSKVFRALCIAFRYKNGKAINANHTVKLGYTLVITEAAEKDAGNYTVVLTNPTNKMQKRHTFTLLVNGKWCTKGVPFFRVWMWSFTILRIKLIPQL